MKTTNITLKELSKKINGNYWEKGELQRIYLERGHNTKKMSTKTFVWQNENKDFIVSCNVSCDNQPYQWTDSQEEQIKEQVYEEIQEILAENVYFFLNKNGDIIDVNESNTAINDLGSSDYFFSKEKAEEVHEEEYLSEDITIKEMNKEEFTALVEKLDKIYFDNAAKEREIAKKEEAKKPKVITEKKQPESVIETIGEGKKVSHIKFGVGVILSETETKVEIDFGAEYGIKSLLKQFANLTRL